MAIHRQQVALTQEDRQLLEIVKALTGQDYSTTIREALRKWALYTLYPQCDTEGRRQLWELLEPHALPPMKGA